MLSMPGLWSSYYRDEPQILSPNNSVQRLLKPRLETVIVSVFLIARSLAGGLVAAPADQKPLSDLERQAQEVLSKPDNVARRARIAPVFQLAERYDSLGQRNKAMSYYTKALEHEPWNLAAQLAMARLLYDAGQTNSARQKADLVWDHAETDDLLKKAAKLLGKPFDAQLPSDPWPPGSTGMALVPIGNVDAWLVLELRAELPGFIGIPVVIQRRQLEIPKPGRDPVHLRAEDLRERMAKARKEADFQALLRKLNVATNSLSEDEDVFAVTMAVLGAGPDQDQARRFRDELAFLRRLGPQWDADELVARMRRTFAPQPGSGRGYLGVTTMDLYANESRYVFGMAGIGANCGVFSYRRYTGAVSDEPPDRERLKRRALKQALSSTGLMFGLPRCTDPTCARAYANGLAEHDAKQVKLCPQCQQAFAKYFGN